MTWTDRESANQYIAEIGDKKCDSILKSETHLEKIHELYKKLLQCDPVVTKSDTSQIMLTETLIASLPDQFRMPVNQAFRGQKLSERSWSKTMRVAKETAQDLIKIVKSREKNKKPQPKNVEKKKSLKTNTYRGPRDSTSSKPLDSPDKNPKPKLLKGFGRGGSVGWM